MGSVQSCGLHEALVISGGCLSTSEVKILVGDWAWRWWWCSHVQRLSLAIMTLGNKVTLRTDLSLSSCQSLSARPSSPARESPCP